MMKKVGTIMIGVFIIIAIIYISTRKEGPLAYIPNADDGTISVVDTDRDEVVRTIKVGSQH
ncbi:hypothetical protein EKG37_17870 [Robertmurraya yapensis]|uniref:Uncharacterized protein n=1 Tax=Bacillus yapensis TaxID=2492960 RepID=A0A431VY87_9BACI|nr:hypothetical protein [Bacillus yapensis]RTR28168.1 hypothetical protein EKG37_17870 [Bacillus yapensis]TKS94412.1 hypothetical protein FAR12_17880 [Bacillus yapensis]